MVEEQGEPLTPPSLRKRDELDFGVSPIVPAPLRENTDQEVANGKLEFGVLDDFSSGNVKEHTGGEGKGAEIGTHTGMKDIPESSGSYTGLQELDVLVDSMHEDLDASMQSVEADEENNCQLSFLDDCDSDDGCMAESSLLDSSIGELTRNLEQLLHGDDVGGGAGRLSPVPAGVQEGGKHTSDTALERDSAGADLLALSAFLHLELEEIHTGNASSELSGAKSATFEGQEECMRRRNSSLDGVDPTDILLDMSARQSSPYASPDVREIKESDLDRCPTLVQAAKNNPNMHCIRQFEAVLRMDQLGSSITAVLARALAGEGLQLVRRQGNHVLARVADGAHKGAAPRDYDMVDLQVVGSTRIERLLVVQVLSHRKEKRAGWTEVDSLLLAIGRTLEGAEVTQGWLSVLLPTPDAALDPGFEQQLEELARWELREALRSAALQMEEHVRSREWQLAELLVSVTPALRRLNEQVPLPPPHKPLSSYEFKEVSPRKNRVRPRPRSLAIFLESRVPSPPAVNASATPCAKPPPAAAVGSPSPGGAASVAGEAAAVEAEEQFPEPTSRREQLLRAALVRLDQCADACDAELQARVQRKHLQVLDRIEKGDAHEDMVVRLLRSHPSARDTPASVDFRSRFPSLCAAELVPRDDAAGATAAIPPDTTVLFDCAAVVGPRPGAMYITPSHICFYSKIIGFVSTEVVDWAQVTSVQQGPTGFARPFSLEISCETRRQPLAVVLAPSCTQGVLHLAQKVHAMRVREVRGASVEPLTYVVADSAAPNPPSNFTPPTRSKERK